MEQIYRVTASKIVSYEIEVEAESIEEAKQLITEEIQENEGIYNYEIEASNEEFIVTDAELHDGYYVTAS